MPSAYPQSRARKMRSGPFGPPRSKLRSRGLPRQRAEIDRRAGRVVHDARAGNLAGAAVELEALAGAVGVTGVSRAAVRLGAVDAGVDRRAIRAAEAVRLVVDVRAGRRGIARGDRLAVTRPAAVDDRRDLAARTGRRGRRAGHRARAAAVRIRARHAGRARLVAVAE